MDEYEKFNKLDIFNISPKDFCENVIAVVFRFTFLSYNHNVS